MRLDKLPTWLQRAIGLAAEGAVVAAGLFIGRSRHRAVTPVESEQDQPMLSRPRHRWVRMPLTILAVALILTTIWVMIWRAEDPGLAQPIPFSHRIHVQTKNINCLFCHNIAPRSPRAGMPPVEKCLLCHNVIASNFPPIAKIREHKRAGKSIRWQRVNKLPEFVHFSHQIHISRQVDCGQCHGNVRRMDRVTAVHNLRSMGFCINCHWKYNASTDCFTCHY